MSVPTEDQVAAARAFVIAFGRSQTSGGGRDVWLTMPDGERTIRALDGWRGEDAAIDEVALALATLAAQQWYPRRMRSLVDRHLSQRSNSAPPPGASPPLEQKAAS